MVWSPSRVRDLSLFIGPNSGGGFKIEPKISAGSGWVNDEPEGF